MEADNIKIEEGQPKPINVKPEVKRSSSYPSLTITEAYEFARVIDQHYSATNIVTRDEIAKSMKLKNGNSVSRDVAACVQFSFLSKEPDGYKLTPLFTDILRFENEKQKKIDFIKAFGSPKLYIELIKKFDGQTIPQELSNTLIKHHSIAENAAKEAAKVFIDSAKLVGVMDDSRFLQYEVTLSSLSKSLNHYTPHEDVEQEDERQPIAGASLVPVNSTDFVDLGKGQDKRVPIHLTKDKLAYLVYPNEVSSYDVELIKHQLEGILLRLKFEKEEHE